MPNRIPTLGSRPKAESDRDYDQTRRRDDDMIRTARWQRYREWVLRRAPLCCNPISAHEHERPATQVHHIEGRHRRPDLAFALSNTAPLCTKCHAAISAEERQGKATAHLFVAWREQAARIELGE